jgi:hypothetical protein
MNEGADRGGRDLWGKGQFEGEERMLGKKGDSVLSDENSLLNRFLPDSGSFCDVVV